jgi:hypothetical protein
MSVELIAGALRIWEIWDKCTDVRIIFEKDVSRLNR